MEQKIIQFIQYRRHELMNQLQMIQGYIQLKKLDLAIDKIGEVVEDYEQERRLFYLRIPKFTWWLFTLPLEENWYPLTYEISNFSQTIEHLDETILLKSQEIIGKLLTCIHHTQVSEGKINLIEDGEDMIIHVDLHGDFSLLKERHFDMQEVSYTVKKDKMTAIYSVALHKKV
ncbi:MAG TPA: Spo0B domain-containing protein [Cerasibacillus sp.]|uniref:Spo0B domain-containing protein n=1 Tax=Cerasibacillus sp. TaxID=2498711 RepID=UPI002F3E88F0